MTGIRDEIRKTFQEGDALNRLILVNLGVYLLYIILNILGFLFREPISGYFIEWTALPSNLTKLATRPWTLVTYMFLHQGFLHILFNLLILFFTGRIFMEYMGGRKLLSVYLLGGLAGGLLYVIFYNVFPAFEEFLATSNNRGASAGVMAVLIGAATYAPRFPVRLFFVITLEFRWVALLILLMDLIYLGDGNNAGGHIAHLGGAALGYFAVAQYKRGNDITEGFSRFMDNIVNWFKPRPKIRKVYSNTRSKRDIKERKDQHRMNDILDKINRSGYDSLSKEEKDYLFKIGKD